MKAITVLKLFAALCFAGMTARAVTGEAEEHSHVQGALEKAMVTLQQAVEIAQKEIPGGKATEAELNVKGQGHAIFDVELLAGKAEKYVEIDAVGGKVLSVKEEEGEEKEEAEEANKGEAKEAADTAKAVAAAKVTMVQAIEIALKELKDGKPYAAELELEAGQPVYEVKLLAGGEEKEVKVGAVEGKVLSVEDEEEGEEQGMEHGGKLWNFDKDPVGKLPEGWSIRETRPSKEKAVWAVTADPTAHSKPNVLALVKTENTGGTFNLLVADKTSFKDLDLSVRMKANTGKEDQGGGPIWRAKDENNYYICRNNPLETNYRLYKVVGGKRTQLASTDVKTDTGKWYTLRVTMNGDQIACYLDGEKLLEAKDDTFKDAGMIGLWTKADAASSFDDLTAHAARGAEDREEVHKDEGSKGKAHAKAAKDDEDDDDDR